MNGHSLLSLGVLQLNLFRADPARSVPLFTVTVSHHCSGFGSLNLNPAITRPEIRPTAPQK